MDRLTMQPDLIFCLVGLLLILLGLPLALRKVGPNAWYGFRVPATLRNREIWYAVNARAGRDLIATGVLLLVVLLLVTRPLGLPRDAAALVCALVLIIGAAAGTVRGCRMTNRLSRARQPNAGGAG
ncbi:MAG TPA: SdpI family protein [Gemmatimonadales bacterium]|jgi:uncharacterized membrane protein